MRIDWITIYVFFHTIDGSNTTHNYFSRKTRIGHSNVKLSIHFFAYDLLVSTLDKPHETPYRPDSNP